MRPNRIFKTNETPYPAVDAVLNHGFAAIGHDSNLALPFCKRVIEALTPYDIAHRLAFIADYCVVVDLNRFPISERTGLLAEAIRTLT